MENVRELQKFIWNLGMFSGAIKLTITLESQFEGYSGRATECWEKQASIQIESKDENICPNIKIIGREGDDIDAVAYRVLKIIEDWKSSLVK